ncbi:killer toxin subunits alpha beta [Fusarium sp. NRRL 25303]|nr:killer toxin subunits alpha beta [Fusarium sp. NRRL 25303]
MTSRPQSSSRSMHHNKTSLLPFVAQVHSKIDDRQAAIDTLRDALADNIIDIVVTVRGGSNLNPLKWWLHVRCDDPDGKCPCNPGSGTLMAYTTNRDSGSRYARINFCPAYFELPNLYQVVMDNSNKELPIEHRANLNNYYKNKDQFEELVTNACDGYANSISRSRLVPRVITYRLGFWSGLAIPKGLAKFKLGAVWWLKRNADNFAMYAMAKTVQKATGNYPHLLLAVTLKGVQDNPGLFMTGNIIIDREGRTTIVGPKDQGECQAPDDEDGPGDKDNVVPFNSSAWFMDESYYPKDYNRQVRGWLADANPRHNRIRIVLMQTAAGPQWIVVQDTPEDPIKDFCLAKVLSKIPANGEENNLEFPTELPAFDAHGAKGCVYSGTSNIEGSLACEDGPSDIRCWEDPEWREMSYCDGGKYMLGIKRDWA